MNLFVTESKKNYPPRLDFLDSLRGWAAIWIFLYHMVKMHQPNMEIPIWAKFVEFGGMGIGFFFMISSFSLYLSREAQKNESVFVFYLRRFFRIAPFFYLWIAGSLIRDAFFSHKFYPAQEIASYVFFVFNFCPEYQKGIVWAGWMVGVLSICYLLFPLVHKKVDDIWKAIGLFFISICCASVFNVLLLYIPITQKGVDEFFQYSFVRHFPVFAYGIILYFVFTRFVYGKSWSKGAGFAFLGIALFMFNSLISGNIKGTILSTYFWQPIAFSFFIVGFFLYPVSIFINKTTRFLGKISYSIYLNHPPLVFFMNSVYHKIYEWPICLTLRYLICVFVTLSILIPVSYLTHRLIEIPGVKLGRIFLSIIPPKNRTAL